MLIETITPVSDMMSDATDDVCALMDCCESTETCIDCGISVILRARQEHEPDINPIKCLMHDMDSMRRCVCVCVVRVPSGWLAA